MDKLIFYCRDCKLELPESRVRKFLHRHRQCIKDRQSVWRQFWKRPIPETRKLHPWEKRLEKLKPVFDFMKENGVEPTRVALPNGAGDAFCS